VSPGTVYPLLGTLLSWLPERLQKKLCCTGLSVSIMCRKDGRLWVSRLTWCFAGLSLCVCVCVVVETTPPPLLADQQMVNHQDVAKLSGPPSNTQDLIK